MLESLHNDVEGAGRLIEVLMLWRIAGFAVAPALR